MSHWNWVDFGTIVGIAALVVGAFEAVVWGHRK